MTKQEKIQEAYGEYWQESKSFINENGWINTKEWLGGIGNTQIFNKIKGIELECMDNYDHKYCYWFRPKSLQGIETNNGWIKVESEDDLPKEIYNSIYWVASQNGWIENTIYSSTSIEQKYKNGTCTHYKPIEKPEQPIY